MRAPATVLDARGLEPPQPLVLALEAASRLRPGEEIRLLTDRRPVHLLGILEGRGLHATMVETPDLCETTIHLEET